MIRRIGLFITIVACNSVEAQSYDLRFSADSKSVAYIRCRSISQFPIPDARQIADEAEVVYASGPAFDAWHNCKIAKAGEEFGNDGLNGRVAFAFSPNSSLIATIGPYSVGCLDVKSHRYTLLDSGAGFDCSVEWASQTDVLYAKVVTSLNGDNSTLRLYRASVSGFKPVELSSIENAAGCSVFWAPRARHVILGPSEHRGWTVIDVESRKKSQFGNPTSETAQVSWSRDGAAALCMVAREYKGQVDAYDVNLKTLALLDVSKSMDWTPVRASGAPWQSPWEPWYAMRRTWTDDGEIIFDVACWTVDPHRWTAKDIPQMANRLLRAEEKPNRQIRCIYPQDFYLISLNAGNPKSVPTATQLHAELFIANSQLTRSLAVFREGVVAHSKQFDKSQELSISPDLHFIATLGARDSGADVIPVKNEALSRLNDVGN